MGPAEPTEHLLHLSDTRDTETLTLPGAPVPTPCPRPTQVGTGIPCRPRKPEAPIFPPSPPRVTSTQRSSSTQQPVRTRGPAAEGDRSAHQRWGLKPRPGARAASVPGAPSGGRRSHRRRFQPAEPPASSSKCGKELPQPPHPRPRQENREAGPTASWVPLGAPRPAQRPAERAGWAGAESGQHFPARPLPMGQLRGDPASFWLAELLPSLGPQDTPREGAFPQEQNAGGKARMALQQAWPWEEKEIFLRHHHGAKHHCFRGLAPPD